MTTHEEEPFLLPAQPQLIALAVTMRPTWDADELERAICGARTAGWSWEKTYAAVHQLLTIRDSTPYHLTVAVRDPRNRPTTPSSGPSAEYLEAKAALAQKAGGDHDHV